LADADLLDPALAAARDRLFLEARTPHQYADRPLPPGLLQQLWQLVALPPTAFNASPVRLVFVVSPEAKARLLPALSPGNVDKTRRAPATAIVAYDQQFYQHLPQLFPQTDAARFFVNDPALAEIAARRNATLQGAYLILAARLLGLDPGPMSGFDNAKVDQEFFPDGRVRSDFLVNLGYADGSALPPRNPRLTFEQACSVL